jgi:LPXTG-motif cell wall-anchored protein
MRKNKAFLALLVAALAAAVFALPAVAMAETVSLTQANFDTLGGVYYIRDGNTYQLAEDVTGYFCVKGSDDQDTAPTIDLNGFTLTSNEEHAVLLDGGPTKSVQTTVKGGNIVVTNTEKSAVRIASNSAMSVTLEDVAASTVQRCCLDATSGTMIVNSGTYTTDNQSTSADEAVIYVADRGVCTVNGGSFNLENGGSSVIKGTSACQLYGGVFSDYPANGKLMASSGYIHKTSDGWEVGSGDVPEKALWKVTYNGTVIYFDSTADMDAFDGSHDGCTVERARYVVSYQVDLKEYASELVVVNGKATKPADDPNVGDDNIFKFWSANGTTEFDFNTAIQNDTVLTAVYAPKVATYNGVDYTSLQEALNDAAEDGGTVTLLKDVDEGVTISGPSDVELTLDLGGYKLTNTASGDSVISVTGATNLKIQNGTVTSEDKDCLSIKSGGSVVTLERDLNFHTDADGNEEANALFVNGASTVNVLGGSYTSDGNTAVQALSSATLNVIDGEFASVNSADTICAGEGVTVDFAGETVSGHIKVAKTQQGSEPTVTIHAGTFGDATNAGDIVEGKYLYSATGYTYKVIDVEGDTPSDEYLYEAMFVVYDEDFCTKVYFKTLEDANEYADSIGDAGEVYVINLYRATFVADGETIYFGVYEANEEVGDLPTAPEVAGYTFAGWFVDGEKIDSTYKLNKDVDIVAMWYKDSDKTPSDNPSGDSKKLPQTGDVASIASGLAAVGAAFAGIGAFRRRK